MFAGFFLLFLFMFSVSSYRLAHGQSDFAFHIIWPLFRRGLWEIFGELDEDIYLGKHDCAPVTCSAVFKEKLAIAP